MTRGLSWDRTFTIGMSKKDYNSLFKASGLPLSSTKSCTKPEKQLYLIPFGDGLHACPRRCGPFLASVRRPRAAIIG